MIFNECLLVVRQVFERHMCMSSMKCSLSLNRTKPRETLDLELPWSLISTVIMFPPRHPALYRQRMLLQVGVLQVLSVLQLLGVPLGSTVVLIVLRVLLYMVYSEQLNTNKYSNYYVQSQLNHILTGRNTCTNWDVIDMAIAITRFPQ